MNTSSNSGFEIPWNFLTVYINVHFWRLTVNTTESSKCTNFLKGHSTDFRVNSWYWTGNEILIRFSLCELIPANTKWIDREGLQHEDIVRVSLANELKDGRRRRGRNLWSNQAKSPASKKGREFLLFNRELYPCFLCYITTTTTPKALFAWP